MLSVLITENRLTDTEEAYRRDRFLTLVSKDYGFSFRYPESVTMSDQISYGDEIPCHIDFTEKQTGLTGFIQVWMMDRPLKEFLDQSFELSELEFSSFTSRIAELGGEKAYLWEYRVLKNNGGEYLGKEYFVGKNGMMYRLSFFTKSNEWNDDLSSLITVMTSSYGFTSAEMTAKAIKSAIFAFWVLCSTYRPSV